MSTPAGPPDQRSAGPLAPSAWNLPNYLTVFRFFLVPVFGLTILAAANLHLAETAGTSGATGSRPSPCSASRW